MSCKINYNKDGKIESVNAPNEVKSKLFDSIMALPEVNQNPEAALRLYAQVYTPAFKNTYGDWELISKAKIYEFEVNGMYESVFPTHTQEAMFNAAMQANSSESERSGAIKAFGPNIVDLSLKLFPSAEVGQAYVPAVTIPLDENGEPTIDAITRYDLKFKPDDSDIHSSLKIIRALMLSPRKSYPSSQVQGFYNDLKRYGASDQQINLLKNYIEENHIGEINKDELMMGFMSTISYTTQIKEATGEFESIIGENEEYAFSYAGNEYNAFFDGVGNIIYERNGEQISEKEYFDNKKLGENSMLAPVPTSHYSSLTVPGGTNYRENRIVTPEIEPSIKGHAAFAEKNDIGWFRSDEKIGTEGLIYVSTINKTTKHGSKTRRILEVQSDLFQKGRNNQDLVGNKEGYNVEGVGQMQDLEEKPSNEQQNQFLQLLNKDNNWVTFFVQSIIQDSAKKGYEKVLFPAGDTAAKVEGHMTLENYIKTKQDRLAEVNKELEKIDDINYVKEVIDYDRENGDFGLDPGEELPPPDYVNAQKAMRNKRQSEITQLNREIEDGLAGRTKFGAINKFYEKDIANILKKRGYNAQRITDEHGNQWYEVNISPIRDLGTIYFSGSDNLESSAASEPTLQKVRDFLVAIGFTEETVMTDLPKIIHNGQPIPVSAMADMIKGVIKIVNGKEAVTLPEEAMHFLVALVKINRPKLYEALISQVRDFKIYKELINDPFYQEDKNYRKENGTLDIEKLKEEAVAKVLTEYLIDTLEGVTEKPELIKKAFTWWDQIKQWIRQIFGKYEDPFQTVVDDLAEGNYDVFGDISDLNATNGSGVFFSATTPSGNLAERDAKFSGNKRNFVKLQEMTRSKNIYKVDDKYYINGKEAPKDARRVSDLVEAYYKDIFRNKVIPEEMREFYDMTRKHGTLIHNIFDDVFKRLIDPETGLLRDQVAPMSPALANDPTIKPLYDYFAKAATDRLLTYPEGTRFAIEQIIYDPERNMFGTVDFIAILPDNRTDILDWKTVHFEEVTKMAGIKEYKEEAFNIQIKQYKKMLHDAYGFDKFRYLRAIPIKKLYRNIKDEHGIPTGEKALWSVQIGASDPVKIEDEGLKPVIVREETTGNKKLDSFINILEKVKEDLKARSKGKGSKLDIGAYELIKKSIYELRTQQNVSNLYRYSAIELANIRKLIENINLNKDNYTNEDVNNILADLNYYDSLMKALGKANFLIRDEILDQTATKDLNKLLSAYENAEEEIKDLRKELADKVAKNFGIFNLLKSEKVMHFWGKYMRNMSQSQSSAIQLLYKLASKAYNRVNLQNSEQDNELANVRHGVDEWAKRNGKSIKEALSHLLKLDKDGEWTGNLISPIAQLFFDQRNAVIKSGDKNIMLQWWNENYNLNEYVKWYNAAFEAYKAEVKSTTYSQDPKVDLETKTFLVNKYQQRYNILEHPTTALGPHNKHAWSENIKREKWYSKEYQFLQAKGNEELLAAYEQFTKINKELVDLGIIEAWRQNTFVPSVRKGFAETFAFEDAGLFHKTKEGVKTWWGDFKDSFKVTDEQLNFSGYINPLTGQHENKLFAGYIAELGEWIKDKEGNTKLSYSHKSADLFTVYSLMNRQKLKFKYLQDVEDIAQALKHVEAAKGSIETSRFGKVQRDRQGDLKVSEDNSKNLEILEKHIRAVVYGEIIQNDADMAITVSYNKFAEAWNKSPFGKIKQMKLRDKDKPHNISATKVIMKLNNANQMRILGVNLASAASNLFGGTASTYLLNKKLFTSSDLTEAATQMVSGQWYATEDMKKRAALLDYFLPILDQRANFHASQLSASQAVRIMSQEWIMSPMRKTEEIVQANIALAIFSNTMVKDGELVNIRKFVQEKNGWGQRFNMTANERNALEKSIEKEIEDLKKSSSIIKTAEFKTVKKAGKDVTVVSIPGVERGSETVEDLRESIMTVSKNALGSSSEFDLAAYKYNLWARLFMTFKNWIPRTLDVRFGEFRYEAGSDAYEWGRARMFWRALSTDWMKTFLKLTPFLGRIVTRTEDKTYLIDKAKELYQEKMQNYKDLGLYDESQFIKEDDFIQAYLQGVDATYTEFRNITLLLAIFASAILAPAADDDDETRNWKKKLLRQLDKFTDELSFFYSPQSLVDVMGSKPLPVIGFVTDGMKFVTNVGKEVFGTTFNIQDGKWTEQAKPSKYFFKMFPITKELLGYMPIIDPEMAKDMGIQLTTQNRN